MSMTLSGDGTITGLVAGGLPDASVVDADLSLAANSAPIKTALNASGDAPIYACRAWVNFNGTGTVAIRASGNVSSITDFGVGTYTVNFTTAMEDANYCVSYNHSGQATSSDDGRVHINVPSVNIITSSVRVRSINASATFMDVNVGMVAIFR